MGVVDTGIDSSHPELATTRLGRDWHSSQLEPVDPEGHGTHVAALLGAKRDGIGMHGIAPQAALTSYRIFDAHGSSGYLPYSLGSAAILAAVRVLAAGETYIPVEMMAQSETMRDKVPNYLTRRERDVLNGLLAGQSNKEIARIHNLSEVTIKHHLKSLRSKLGARNRTHAVCRAIELGIADDDTAFA